MRIVAALGLIALTSSIAAAAQLPPGFAQDVVANDVPAVTAFAWGPGGELWIVGKQGQVWRFSEGHPELVARLGVSTEGERGAGGVAVDPDFKDNGAVWIYYTAADPAPHNRLSRFRSDGSRLVDEVVVIDGPILQNAIHNGGCLRFAPDKSLFLAMGDDDQRGVTAQNPRDVRGKLLHLNRDGSPAADNPYRDGAAGHPLVWALGFRNPWRFGFQPGSGALFIGDVGADLWEELDIGIAGGNYGWDSVEGPQPPGQPGFVYPIYTYPHDSERGNAIIAGGHVPPGNFPPEYQGDYFFGDATASRLSRMKLDSSNRPTSTEIWATEVGTPVDIQFGSDGALYYADFSGSQIRRISFVGGSRRQPVALAVATPDSGPAPLTVLLDGSASHDPDGGALAFSWEFGDGSGSQEPAPTHTYPTGAFEARLTVTNVAGGTAPAPPIRIVSGNHRPTARIEYPTNESSYVPGQTLKFSGFARDLEDGELGCSQFEWRVLLHHLPPAGGVGHIHPYLGPLTGTCGGSFVAAPHEEDNVYYEVVFVARDTGRPVGPAAALSATRSVVVRPRKP